MTNLFPTLALLNRFCVVFLSNIFIFPNFGATNVYVPLGTDVRFKLPLYCFPLTFVLNVLVILPEVSINPTWSIGLSLTPSNVIPFLVKLIFTISFFEFSGVLSGIWPTFSESSLFLSPSPVFGGIVLGFSAGFPGLRFPTLSTGAGSGSDFSSTTVTFLSTFE